MKTGLYAGFDLGGSRLKYGLIGNRGRPIFKGGEPTPDSAGDLMSLLEDVWKRLQALQPGRIRSAGFGFAGFFSLREQKIIQSPNCPGLDGFDLVPALSSFVDVPFRLDNDANLAAFGEWRRGAGRGAGSLVLLTIGTGVGSGIVLDRGLWHGSCGFAGEIGHITVNPEGSPCKCGAAGCLETEVSATKIVDHYASLTGEPGLSSKDVYKRAREGDPDARESFARCARYLGIGLGIIINFMNPEKILLGGGVMNAEEFLLPPALEEARARASRPAFACCEIEKAALGNDAGFIGAAEWGRAGVSGSRRR
jgi:glucokinase